MFFLTVCLKCPCHPRLTTLFIKAMGFWLKFWFSSPPSLQPGYCRPFIFQTKYSVRSNNLSLTFQRSTPSGCKDKASYLKFIIFKPDFVDHWYFTTWILLNQTVNFFNIKGFHYRVTKIFLELYRVINSLKKPFQVLSRDSVTVTVDAVVYYRVSNPTMATNNVEDYGHSTHLLGATTLR